MNKKLKLFLGFLPLTTLCSLVFWFSAQNADESSLQSGVFVKFIKKYIIHSFSNINDPADEKIVDRVLSIVVRKCAHFTAYFLIGVCAFGAFWFISKKGLRFLIAVGGSALYAGSDEIHQLFVAGRAGKLLDVFIDTSGAATGALICLMVVLIIEMQEKKDEIDELKEKLRRYESGGRIKRRRNEEY